MNISQDPLRYLSIDDLQISMLLSQDQMTVTKVAHLLNLTQPAVTQRIRKIELAFGKSLIIRNGRGIRLTEFGMNLSKQAAIALDALHSASIVDSASTEEH